MMSSSFMGSQFPSEALCDGLDSVSRFTLLPWSLLLLRNCLGDLTWEMVVSSYGVLYSTLIAGRLFGRFARGKNSINKGYVSLLGFSFLGLAFTTRYSFFLLLYFLIGFSGVMISYIPSSLPKNKSYNAFNSGISSQLSSLPSKSSELASEESSKRSLIALIFAALFSGTLYDEDELSMFPARYPCYIIFLICSIIWCIWSWQKISKLYYEWKKYIDHKLRNIVEDKRNSTSQSYTDENIQNGASGSFQGIEKFVHQGPDEWDTYDETPPEAYIKVCNGNIDEARKSYIATMRWRRNNEVDSVLDTYQDHFEKIIELYPHLIHGFAKDGSVVVYERLGSAKPASLFSEGITPDHMTRHFLARNELIFKRFVPDVEIPGTNKKSFGQLMTVLDVKGIRVADISTDVIKFIKQSSEITDSHYPGRVARLVICNAPIWFYSVWSMVANVLPADVVKKISIISGTKKLTEFIDPSQLSEEYGGTGVPFGSTPENKAFLELPLSWIKPEFDRKVNIIEPSVASINNKKDSIESPVKSKKDTNGWMGSLFGGNNTQVAYLGEKNGYRFDSLSSTWIFNVDDEISTPISTTKEMSTNELEEHGLVLAIQAAHIAYINSKDISRNSANLYHSDDKIENNDQEQSFGISINDDFGKESVENINNNIKQEVKMMSPQVFLLVISMYTFSCLVQTGILTLLPVWLASDISQGGLGYRVSDIGLILSGTGIFLLIATIFLHVRLLFILRSSPVKSLRIACGVLVFVCLLIPIVLSERTGIQDGNTYHEITFKETHYIDTQLNYGKYRPSFSFFYIPWPSFLFSLLVGASFFGRKAAGVLLHIALSPSFSSPSTIITTVGRLCDIVGTTILTLIFSGTYRHHFRYPMDSTFFLSLGACICASLYLGTLLINVHFRGDFGIVSEQGVGDHRPNGSSNSFSNSTKELLSIPIADLNLLFGTSVVGGVSVPLYNLKMDLLKDV